LGFGYYGDIKLVHFPSDSDEIAGFDRLIISTIPLSQVSTKDNGIKSNLLGVTGKVIEADSIGIGLDNFITIMQKLNKIKKDAAIVESGELRRLSSFYEEGRAVGINLILRKMANPEEEILRDQGLNRVTDTCIPEIEAMRRIEQKLYPHWEKADREGKRYFPHEFMYELIRNGELEEFYQIDPKDSWMVAACEKNLPIFTPGWEDSTLGNEVVAEKVKGRVKSLSFIRSGLETEFRIHLALGPAKMAHQYQRCALFEHMLYSGQRRTDPCVIGNHTIREGHIEINPNYCLFP